MAIPGSLTSENATASALASRLGRHSGIYGVGVVLTVLASLATLAVFTRLMAPDEFGVLAVLFVVASGLRVLYVLAVVAGTIALVFGAGEDSDVDLSDDIEPVSDKREMLGTGLVLVVAFAGSGTVVMWVLAPEIAQLLFDASGRTEGVRLAAVAAGLAGIARLLLTVPRFERLPQAYITLNMVGPVVAFAVGTWLVAGGDGAEGALVGIVVGAATSVVVLLVFLRTRYRLCFTRSRALRILKVGVAIVPLILALFIIGRGGMVILSQSSIPRVEVGYYAVALLFGLVILRLNGVFFMAWIPMKRTSLLVAVHKQRGQGWLYSTLTTYLVLGLCATLVVLTALAGALVQIAGPGYADAEHLIMLLGLAALAQCLFVFSYRMSSFPRKRVALMIVATLAIVWFLTGAVALVRIMGVEGVPTATGATFVCACAAMLWLNQRGPHSIPFQYWRLGGITLATAICLAVHTLLREPAGQLRPLLDVGTVVLFAALILGLRIVTRKQLGALAAVARDAGRLPRRKDLAISARLATLAPAQAAVLNRAAGPSRAAADEPLPAPDAFVRALRIASDIGESTAQDAAIGRYLLSPRSRAERDEMARALWRQDVAPAELDLLEEAFEKVRRLPRSTWDFVKSTPLIGANGSTGSPPHRAATFLPGRDDDLAALLQTYATVTGAAGGGQTVFVAGAVGSGRTTLLHALEAALARTDPDAFVLAGGFSDGRFVSWDESGSGAEEVAAVPSGAGVQPDALAPFIELVDLAIADGAGALEPTGDLAEQGERLDPAQLLVRLLRDLCAQGPVVCLVDDTEQAPGGLWGDVLLALARGARDLPLLLVIAIDRPAQLEEHEDDEPDSLYVARRLCADGLARWHELDDVAIEDLARWTGPAAPEVLHQLLAIVVGRAAWAAQLWRHWQTHGVIVLEGAHPAWRFGLNGRARAMNPVEDVVGARLRQVVGTDKATLERVRTQLAYAALEGRVFTADAVGVALDCDHEEIIDLFDDTLGCDDDERRDGFVRETDLVLLDDETGRRHLLRYRFDDELDWLTLYDHGLKETRRPIAARALAHAVVAVYAGRAQRVAHVLARLFETANDPNSARRFRRLHDAGPSRSVILARARAIVGDPDPVDRFERRRRSQILIAAAREQLRSGSPEEGLRLVEAGYRLAPLRFDQADALYLSGTHHFKVGDLAQARAQLALACELRLRLEDRKGEADARAALALVNSRDGEPEQARGELASILDIYRGLGDHRGQAEILFSLAQVHLSCGARSQARDALGEARDLLRKLGDRRAEANVRDRIAGMDLEDGSFAEARDEFMRALALYRDVGSRHGEADTLQNLARIDVEQGARAQARAAFERALDLYLELDDRHSEAAAWYSLASIDLDEGDVESALGSLGHVLALGDALQDDDVVAAALQALEALDRAQPD